MKYFIVLCLVLVVVSETQAAVRKNLARIYNGRPAKDGNFPHQVFMMLHHNYDGNGGFMTCGGSLITPKHVLTAAHCLEFVEHPSQLEEVVLMAGFENIMNFDLSLRRTAIKITTHNFRKIDYGAGNVTGYNDIAIIELNEPYTMSSTLKTIALNDEQVQPGTTCIVSGFGDRDHYLQPKKLLTSLELFSTAVDVIDNTSCEQRWHIVFDKTQICAIGHGGQTTGNCHGDSGGPLVCNGKLSGVFSSTAPCGMDMPNIFVNVKVYIPWIEAVIRDSGYSLQL